VIELDPREVLRKDAQSKDPVIPKRLLKFCRSRTSDTQQAKDMMSEAVARTLAGEGWHRWRYDGVGSETESLLMHLFNVARDVLKKERESAQAWREVRGKEKDAPVQDVTATPGEKPVEWAAHEDDMRRAETVMDRLDEEARQMLRVESESEKKLDAKALAEKLGWSVKQVYRARERVVYHRDLVLAAERKRGGPGD